MSGHTTSATTTVKVITIQDATNWTFWPSTWSQQNAIVSCAVADGKSAKFSHYERPRERGKNFGARRDRSRGAQ